MSEEKNVPSKPTSDEKNVDLAEGKPSWRFPRTFWTGNAAELCERAAYYGTFIALRTYLIRVVGLDDVQAGVVAGLFGGWIYLVPFFTGAAADRMGFRKALILAFALLTVGYGTLGVFSHPRPGSGRSGADRPRRRLRQTGHHRHGGQILRLRQPRARLSRSSTWWSTSAPSPARRSSPRCASRWASRPFRTSPPAPASSP